MYNISSGSTPVGHKQNQHRRHISDIVIASRNFRFARLCPSQLQRVCTASSHPLLKHQSIHPLFQPLSAVKVCPSLPKTGVRHHVCSGGVSICHRRQVIQNHHTTKRSTAKQAKIVRPNCAPDAGFGFGFDFALRLSPLRPPPPPPAGGSRKPPLPELSAAAVASALDIGPLKLDFRLVARLPVRDVDGDDCGVLVRTRESVGGRRGTAGFSSCNA